MLTNKIQQDNLFKAYGLFIEGFRPYVVSVLMKEAGDQWPVWFVASLYPSQKRELLMSQARYELRVLAPNRDVFP